MRRTALTAIVLMMSAIDLSAQLSAQLASEKGFRADGVYQVTPYDVVDLFSGNLHLDIPVGGSYRLSDSLSYQIRLRYSGSSWTLFEKCPEKFPGENSPDCRTLLMLPPDHSNAGLGWLIGFGELRTHTIIGDDETGFFYRSPDGASHLFFEVLHHGDAEDANDTDGKAVSYTRDGTYLRMQVRSASVRVVEFPDGEKHRFALVDGAWRLTHIYNGFSTVTADGTPSNNYVAFAYPASATYAGIDDIVLTDSLGRTQSVRFKPAPVATDPPILSSVLLTTYKNGPAAEYRFKYRTNSQGGEGIVIPKPYDPTNGGSTVTVPLLSAIERPLGETFQFDYVIPSSNSHDSGLIRQMVLPTLGKVEWEYAVGNFASESGYETDTGVSARRVYGRSLDSASYVLEQYTRYVASLGSCLVQTMTGWTDATGAGAKVDAQVRNYFDNGTGGLVGLPFKWSVEDADHRYLSTESYDCAAGGTCTLHRQTWARFEMDERSSSCQSGACLYDRNRRQTMEKNGFVTDGSAWSAASYSDFDGLGHYRTTLMQSSFGPERIRRILYNQNTRGYDAATRTGSSVGTYIVNDSFVRSGDDTFNMLRPGDAWVLGTFTGQETGGRVLGLPAGRYEYRVFSASQACFDLATGFLERQRKLRSVNPQLTDSTVAASGSDLLAVYTHDSDGNLQREEYFGGDAAATLSTTAGPCSVPAAHASGTYRLDRARTTYPQYYTRTAQYKDAAGGATGSLNFFAADDDFDRWTDLPWQSRDSSGITTTYDYDALGRLTWVKPGTGHGAWTQYEYAPASSTTSGRAEVVIRQRPNGSSSGVLAQSVLEYDALGRIFRERKQLKDGSWSVTDTRYDHVGRRAKVSVTGAWGGHAVDSSNWTTTTYDALGRPLAITAPDGKTTSFTYTGVRLVRRNRSIATSSGERTVAVDEEYDAFGNLVRVREAADTSSWVEGRYTYDFLDHLSGVSVQGSASTKQDRSFVYDGRGLLTSEQHPESGTTSYQYDARGHAVSRTTPAGALAFTYDRAERLETVKSGATLLKELFYDRDNSGNDRSRGKMARSVRHNHQQVLGGDITVTETYQYGGTGGALSAKTTAIGTGETFTDSYSYSELGNVVSVGYPDCSGAPCSGVAQPSRVVTNSYVNGYLSAVGDYTGSIEYWPNGMVKSIRHRNAGLTDGTFTDGPLYEQTIDSVRQMPRPDTIKVSNVCTDLKVVTQPAPVSVASGQSATLSVSVAGATRYQWFSGNGTPAGTDAPSITVSPATTTTYWVRASNGTCTIDSARATVAVTGSPTTCTAPPATITATSPLDAGASGTASVPETTGATYVWTISGGQILTGSGTRTITFRASCTGTVALHVAVTAACGAGSESDRLLPVVQFSITVSGSASIQSGQGTDLIADLTGPAPWKVTWSDGVVENDVRVTPWRRQVFPAVTTDYTATMTNANACSGTSSGVARVAVGEACATADSSIRGLPASLTASSTASAVVATTSGASYAWTITGGTIISGRGTPSITFRAGCSGTVTLTTIVTTGCGTSTSSRTVEVRPLSATLAGSAVDQGASGTLTATMEGTSPWTLTWSDGLQETAAASPRVRTVTPGATTSYTVTAQDGAGCTATSNTATVTVVPPPPVLLAAAATSADRVTVRWTYSGTADTFSIERYDRLPGSPAAYRVVGTAAAGDTAFVDPGLPANSLAMYRVRAVRAGTSSAPSGADPATTVVFADDPIVVNVTRASATHISQLRTAVNALRALGGLAPATFTDSGSLQLSKIRGTHITELRTALDDARRALSLPPLVYADQPLPASARIRPVHVTDLRGGVK